MYEDRNEKGVTDEEWSRERSRKSKETGVK